MKRGAYSHASEISECDVISVPLTTYYLKTFDFLELRVSP